jgi:hypothetical protein
MQEASQDIVDLTLTAAGGADSSGKTEDEDVVRQRAGSVAESVRPNDRRSLQRYRARSDDRYRGDRVLRASVNQLVRIRQIDKRISLLVDDAHDMQTLEKDRHAFSKHVLLPRQLLFERQLVRHLTARYRRLGTVLSDTHRSFEAAGACTRDVARDALNFRIVVRLHHHTIILSEPAKSSIDLTDEFSCGREGGERENCE